ncbi:respiratory nitrate reductase subunit gamma [Granulosicoccus sp.]|nr:respiratory nitrate reductase subunit gamma [Granulosicoccus sp.]
MQGYPNRLAVSDALLGIGFTVALLWALLATSYRLLQWSGTPSPLPIPLTPAPKTRLGVIGRLLLELFAFRALLRANKTTWLASLLFHYGLLFVLIMHIRFMFEQLPSLLIPFIVWSGWAAGAMVIGLCVLLARRVFIDRMRYISAPSDYLHLLLLIAIAISGACLKRFWPVDTAAVGEFFRGVVTLHWQPLPESAVLWVHLLLVLVLIIVFPVSKLLHGLGILFSPTLNQRDTAAKSQARSNDESAS